MATSSYTLAEVRVLVEEYAELRELRDTSRRGLRFLLLFADIDRAIAQLPPKEYHAVLLHGLLGARLRDVEKVLGIARQTLLDRYESGLITILGKLEGGKT